MTNEDLAIVPVDRELLGLSIDMLDAERLRIWAEKIETHGADISHWSSPAFVVKELLRVADGIAAAVKDIGTLRLAAAPVPCAPVDETDDDIQAAMSTFENGCDFTLHFSADGSVRLGYGCYGVHWNLVQGARFRVSRWLGFDGEPKVVQLAPDTLRVLKERQPCRRCGGFTFEPLRATGEGARDAQEETAVFQDVRPVRLAAASQDRQVPEVPSEGAPVAVSLGLPEALAAFIDVYDVVFDEDDVVMLQAVLARLRGEATVRAPTPERIVDDALACAELSEEDIEREGGMTTLSWKLVRMDLEQHIAGIQLRATVRVEE